VYLLDTHALVWAIGEPERLPAAARAAVQSNQAKVSVASLWEMIVKKNRHTAPVRDPLVWWDKHIAKVGTEVIPIRIPHVAELDRLPEIHRDPFDRILVAQALAENCTLVTRDSTLARYGVPVVWK
jgi:PIN domain nuclease of toxin-antitoxin system